LSGVLNQIVGKLSVGAEVILGTDMNDYIRPLGGSDLIDAKKGHDTVFVFWPASKFKITTIQGTTYLDAVSGASRSDKLVLRNVEAIEFSDKIVSLEVADTLISGVSKDNFDGGPGIDTVVYTGEFKDYVVKTDVSGMEVSSVNYTEGADWLLNIERLQFKDKGLAFDLEGHAGTAAKTLSLVFGLSSVYLPEYVGICLDLLDNKAYTPEQLMQAALNVRLGADALDPGKVVDFLYAQLTGGGLPSPSDKAAYVDLILNKTYSIAGLAVAAAEPPLNPIESSLMGLATSGLPFILPS
jgi:Ca2+-binding RTX toxin-like protein